LSVIDGVVSYYNRRETDLAPYLDGLRAAGRGIVGIRPLEAGTIRDAADVASAIHFALDHPAISSTIVGLSSVDQIDAAVAAATYPADVSSAPSRL
jgi:hypothetical protein